MKKILTIFLLLTGVLSCHYAIAASTSLTYTYDDHNRLQQVLYGDGSYIEYVYDGVGNIVTATFVGDTDGDGVPNAVDNCPAVANPSQSDANGNGIGDACDSASDSDNDGLSDAAEVLVYHTSPVSYDSDNDVISDGQEVVNGTDPLVSNNGSFNPDGDFHSGVFLDLDVAGGGSQMTRRESLNFHGNVVGSYEVVAASSGGIGQIGEIRILPNPDHTFSVADTDYSGVTANDQSIEVLADAAPADNRLELQITGRKGAGLSVAALHGNYIFSELVDASVSQAPTMVTRRLSLDFDGSGGVTYATLADSTGGSACGSSVYSVLSDGTLDLLGNTGFVSADGEVIVAVDTTVTADPPLADDISLGVGVRRGSGLSTADLAGDFIYYEMGYELHTWTSRYRYHFNGRGTGSFAVTADSDGQVTTTPVRFTYTVSSDGNVSIDGQALGVISANKEYLVFTDTDWNDPKPGIALGVGVKAAVATRDKIGVYYQGNWYFDSNENGAWEWGTDFIGNFGDGVMTPIAGDWNGDGRTEFGGYVSGNWYFDLNGNGFWDGAFIDQVVSGYGGAADDIPVVGDWNGDGVTEIGIYRQSNNVWYLDYNGNFIFDWGTDVAQPFGFAGCIPVVGDWNGNGLGKIGVYKDGQWYLDANGNFVWDGSVADSFVADFGFAGALPVVGDWRGSGAGQIGAYYNGEWFLDADGNGSWSWEPAVDKYIGSFGSNGMLPMVGRW